MSIKGYPSQEKDNSLGGQYATVEPVGAKQWGLTTHALAFLEKLSSKTVGANSTTTLVVCVAHGAIQGQVIRFTSGALSGKEIGIGKVIDANTIQVTETLSAAPAAADTFDLYRFRHPTTDSSGSVQITGSITAANPSVSATGAAVPASATYAGMVVGGNLTGLSGTANGLKVDGSAVTQPVSAASLPLPTGAATSAKQPALGTAGSASSDVISVQGIAGMTALKVDASATTQPVSGTLTANQGTAAAIASAWPVKPTDGTNSATFTAAGETKVSVTQPLPAGTNSIGTVQVKAAISVTGSGSAAASTVSTGITLTAPANATGFVLQNLDTSSGNIRWAIGRTASATLGQQLQAGRDTGFIPCGANVTICAESGTQNYDIQWVSQ